MVKQKGRKAEPAQKVPGACLYCNRNDDDDLKYGKLIYHKESNTRVHHYCLLFASGLCQAGEGNEGIEGFLIPDIQKEYARGSRLVCVYCHQNRATIGCAVKSCRHKYHYGCGVEHKVLFLFYDNFISYCQAHRPQQDPPECPSETPTVTCAICLESVEAQVSEDTLRTPCCMNTWFHRTCVQRQALCAGYFFRCSICNNKEDFQREMKQFGIYIPEQDAAWELEENAYQELYHRHNQCDVQSCICPKGRKYHPSRGKWEVVLCNTCGSRGCHLTCGGLINQWDDWVCDQCEDVVSKLKKQKKSKKTSTEPKSPTEKRKEKLMGKTPRTPLPSSKPMKKKAAASTCPSLSPPTPSDSINSLSIHLPSVSALPSFFSDSSQCSQKNYCSCKKKKVQCTSPCKDLSSPCKKQLPLSPKYGSPPHFCCMSRDSFLHSHESSIPPSLSVDEAHGSKKLIHVCQKYTSPSVKTTSRMSMRGPSTGTPALKRAQESLASLTKPGGHHHLHHHCFSGVYLCARHRQQVQHSWNRISSGGSTGASSHNSSDEIEFGTVQLTPDGRVSSESGMKHLSVTGGKEACVHLKPLSSIIPSLFQRVFLGSNDSESQAVLGSALKPGFHMQHTYSKRKLENQVPSPPRKKFKIGKAPPPKKVENKSPSPRKTLKSVSSPTKLAKESSVKRNLSTTPKKSQQKKKDGTPKKKLSPKKNLTPKKNSTPNKNSTPKISSMPKENLTPKKMSIFPKKKATPNKDAVEIISIVQKGKESLKKKSKKKKLKMANDSGTTLPSSSSESPDVIMIKKVKKQVATSLSGKPHGISSSLFAGKSKTSLSFPSKSSVQVLTVQAPVDSISSGEKSSSKSAAIKKVPVKMKKSQEASKSKQLTLDRYWQPSANCVASEGSVSKGSMKANRQPTKTSDNANNNTISILTWRGIKGIKRMDEGIPKNTSKKQMVDRQPTVTCDNAINNNNNTDSILSWLDVIPKNTSKKQTIDGADFVPESSFQKSVPNEAANIPSSADCQRRDIRDEWEEKEPNSGPNNSLADLLLLSPKIFPKETETSPESKSSENSTERKKHSRSSKRWNAHMDSGEIVFRRSPPTAKPSSERSSSPVDLDSLNYASRFLFKDDNDPEVSFHFQVNNNVKEVATQCSTPRKELHEFVDCEVPTRSSPRFMRDKVKEVPITPALAGLQPFVDKIWVPNSSASSKEQTIALATVSVDKATKKLSLIVKSVVPKPKSALSKAIKVHVKGNKIVRVEPDKPAAGATTSEGEAGGKKKRGVRMEILYPDGLSRISKDKRCLKCQKIQAPSKHTAMSQESCFREMQEFTQTMLATVNPARSATSSPTGSGMEVTIEDEKPMVKATRMSDSVDTGVNLQQKEENVMPSSESSPDECEVLVRRSFRFGANTPTTGQMLVKRSREFFHLKKRKPCDSCKCIKKCCHHKRKKKSKVDTSSSHTTSVFSLNATHAQENKGKVGNEICNANAAQATETADVVEIEEISQADDVCSPNSSSALCSSNAPQVSPLKNVESSNADVEQNTGMMSADETSSTAITCSSESNEVASGTKCVIRSAEEGRRQRQTLIPRTKKDRRRKRHLNNEFGWPQEYHYLQRRQDKFGRFRKQTPAERREAIAKRCQALALKKTQTQHKDSRLNEPTKDDVTEVQTDRSDSIDTNNDGKPEPQGEAQSEIGPTNAYNKVSESKSASSDNTEQETVAVQQVKEDSTADNQMESSVAKEQEEVRCEDTDETPAMSGGNGSFQVDGSQKQASHSQELSQCQHTEVVSSVMSNVEDCEDKVDDVEKSDGKVFDNNETTIPDNAKVKSQADGDQLSVETDEERNRQQETGHLTPIKANPAASQEAHLTSASDERANSDESAPTQNGDFKDTASTTSSSSGQCSSNHSTPSNSPKSSGGYSCNKKQRHTPKCKQKHVHYPVCESPHSYGPKAKARRSSMKVHGKKIKERIPIHVHKPKCLAPHLHGPQPADGCTPKKFKITTIDPETVTNGTAHVNGEVEKANVEIVVECGGKIVEKMNAVEELFPEVDTDKKCEI